MIKEYDLQQIDKIRKEIKLLKNINIEIHNKQNRKKYNKLINKFQYDLEKKLINLEYEIQKIEDSDIRTIIRYRYVQRLNYIQIAHKMNENGRKIYSADSIRMQLKRFIKNSLAVRSVRQKLFIIRT